MKYTELKQRRKDAQRGIYKPIYRAYVWNVEGRKSKLPETMLNNENRGCTRATVILSLQWRPSMPPLKSWHCQVSYLPLQTPREGWDLAGPLITSVFHSLNLLVLGSSRKAYSDNERLFLKQVIIMVLLYLYPIRSDSEAPSHWCGWRGSISKDDLVIDFQWQCNRRDLHLPLWTSSTNSFFQNPPQLPGNKHRLATEREKSWNMECLLNQLFQGRLFCLRSSDDSRTNLSRGKAILNQWLQEKPF